MQLYRIMNEFTKPQQFIYAAFVILTIIIVFDITTNVKNMHLHQDANHEQHLTLTKKTYYMYTFWLILVILVDYLLYL